jgi:hypothetical protein
VVIAVLAKQNRDLKGGGGEAAQASIKEGDYFSLRGLKAVQSNAVLDSTSRRQLVFVFTTRCPFCKETRTYASEQQLTFPVFIPAEKDLFSKTNRLHSVPQTIIRNSNGFVEKVWRGRLTVEQFNEVVKAISGGIIPQNL